MNPITFNIPQRGYYLLLEDHEVKLHSPNIADMVVNETKWRRTGPDSIVVPKYLVLNLTKIYITCNSNDISISLIQKCNKPEMKAGLTGLPWKIKPDQYFGARMHKLTDDEIKQIVADKGKFLYENGLT